MSEQEQAPVEGTPENAGTAEEAPGIQSAEQSVDFEKRYNDMRSEFDRRGSRVTELETQTAAIADLRSDDPDTRTRAAQTLGLPFEFVDDSPAEDDDQMPYLTREEWQAYQAQQQQAQAQAQEQAAQESAIAQIDTAIQSHEALNALDKDDRDWVIAKALSIDPKMTPEGVPLPDIDTALQQFQGWDSGRWERARKSKRAPAIKAGGQVGTQAVPDDATHSQRVAAMLEALEAQQ
jgi:hypothetical protein